MKKMMRLSALLACLLTLCACAANPSVPDVPSQPAEQPGTEEPARPQEPAQPDEPAQPQEPVQPDEPAQPQEPVQPDEPAQPQEPVQPNEPAQPEEPAQPDEPAQPQEPVQPNEPAQPEEPAQPQATLSVRCDTVLDNMDSLNEAVAGLIPSDGVILAETTLALSGGESVFDLLSRAARDNKVHMEYSSTPIYQSAYIEGIGNLYELDCGPLSGWMYRVNGEFPNYGCSKYAVQDGDVIEWVYTCDLGEDVGGAGSFEGQRE